MALVSLKNVCLDQRLRSVSLTINKGEVVGIIGPNGAGKSTLIKALTGLLPPEHGTIELLDKVLSTYSAQERGRLISWIPQSIETNWPISVHDAVELGTLIHGDHAAIDRALVKADLVSLANRQLDSLSGGELARVWFARALASDATLLLADEPVAALDPRYQLELLSRIRAEATAAKAVVVVLHDLQLAAQFCDRLLLIHEGAVIADGSPERVLNSAELKSSFGVSFQVDFDQSPPLIRAVATSEGTHNDA
ncbi:ABC transporter ATP-binding protein [Umboniibacter marinipuniceus]|uniref:Iron complex transport system ATP-binding protein n=1 Tax=Umboniibacter marinipuniceus TaxID=569599 RepID=A0A3M0AE16_9GAMM|nr:ABC transporter ATP-binding protein [Umboniibacter marinipuniceus]RMA82374.1 iron complex transport system ATP-binding protein [Umboniibacter marinipuniceus]